MLLNNWNKACQYFITVWTYYIHVVSERCSVYRRLYLNEIILGYPYVDLCFDYVMWRVGVTEKEQSKQESILNKSCVWIRWRWEKVRVSGDKETDEKLFLWLTLVEGSLTDLQVAILILRKEVLRWNVTDGTTLFLICERQGQMTDLLPVNIAN